MTSIHGPLGPFSMGNGHPRTMTPARRRSQFVIVAIDYFTKWIEAKPLVKITGKEVIRFVMDNLICRFGLPRIIVTDNGAQLVNEPFKGGAARFKIPTDNTSVPTPQANGPQSSKAMADNAHTKEYNEEEQRLNLDLLQEKREAAAIREAKYKTKMEQYYNKRVRPAGFRPGEFVYRRNEASRMENEGKLGPNWEGPYRVTEAFENGSYKLQTMEDKVVPRTWHAVNLRKCYL
ncbi:reverse transcriptase domain-containing protein [Tanacetum coccineum]